MPSRYVYAEPPFFFVCFQDPPTNSLLQAPPCGTAEQMRIQQEQFTPPTGLSSLNAHQTPNLLFQSDNAEVGQALYCNPFPFEKANTETTWRPLVHTGCSPQFSEFDDLVGQHDLIC